MAENIINQFLEVQNVSNWTKDKRNEVSESGQIVFVPGDCATNDKNESIIGVDAIYAKGKNYGDGALSSKTLLTEEITIEGGPLASDAVKQAFEGGVIPAGTDLQELLKALLCVELWSKKITPQNPKVTVANVAPTISGVTNEGLYEVGSKLSITVTLNQTSVGNTSAKISGFEYGMSYNSTEYKGSSHSKREVANNIKYDNDHYAGRYAYSTSENGTMTSEFAFQSVTDAKLAVNSGSKTFDVTTYVGDKNKVTAISAYSKGVSYYNAGIGNTYDMSNLGAISDNAYSIAPVGTASSYYAVAKDLTEKSASVTWVGVYPLYFEGTIYTGNIPAADPAVGTFNKCTTLKKDGQTLNIYVKFPDQSSAGTWKIAVPQLYSGNTTITAKAYNAASGKYDASKTFTKNGTRKFGCGVNNAIQYNCDLFTCAGTDGANGLYLTIVL